MESKKPQNPSAFPHEYSFTNKGMTLRDYFANSAMQGLYSNNGIRSVSDLDLEADANLFYRIADAMLKQREL